MIRIALMAPIRAGKDTVAEHAIRKYGLQHLKFADPFHRITRELFPKEYANGQKPRDLLQWFGQTMRQRDPDVWVDYLLRRVEAAGDQGIVVSDLRQPNEHAALKAAGFDIIKIEANLQVRIARMREAGDKFDPKDLEHETESHIDRMSADYTINNSRKDGGAWARKQLDIILA